ncbi:hypothetical protein SAMN04244570_0025 [Sporosarcina newyorkensis]|uniref:Uncharacterized protein n=1 Tax=Sporosarcina newyorkensis TaxID=759851 RepID=A0A1T4YW00_9BACL|nr:hypothetical protein SAMN04244570_0025 [Sporosarcina newyorkensis]
MSMPNIPNITPNISLDRCETIELLLNSIALEEIALSHIMNAEAEKLQLFLAKHSRCLDDVWKMNNSINKTLRTIVKSQMLLQFKLEDVLELDCDSCKPRRPCKPKPQQCCHKCTPDSECHCNCCPDKEHGKCKCH